MHTYVRGCTCMGRHLRETVLLGIITWSEMGKENMPSQKKSIFIIFCQKLLTHFFLFSLPAFLLSFPGVIAPSFSGNRLYVNQHCRGDNPTSVSANVTSIVVNYVLQLQMRYFTWQESNANKQNLLPVFLFIIVYSNDFSVSCWYKSPD